MRENPKSVTFYSAYLNESVGFDIQNASLEEEAEDQPYRLFAHVSLTRDTRATGGMVPDDVWVQGRDDDADTRELTEQIRTKYDQSEKRIVKKYLEAIDFQVALYDKRETVKCDGIRVRAQAEPPINDHLPSRTRFPCSWTQLNAHGCLGDERLSREE
ncbi:hypothetical protein DL767_006362 [Monosporascus sp. MG133]|nr:hypothetical protein DL767_006362 [Monosporascus sp. MG133]